MPYGQERTRCLELSSLHERERRPPHVLGVQPEHRRDLAESRPRVRLHVDDNRRPELLDLLGGPPRWLCVARMLCCAAPMAIGERYLFTWLHLSDLHFGHGDARHGWNQKTVLSLLAKDVAKALTDWPELPTPEAVVVTGDVAFSGAVRSADEYRDAQGWLKAVASELGLAPDRVYMVPGNHDVQRGVAEDLVEQVRANPGELDAILNDPSRRSTLGERLANFRGFSEAFGGRDLVAWTDTVRVQGFGDVTLIGLNTVLVSNDDEDLGQLHLCEQQRNALASATGEVKLLLTHHPFESGWLYEEDHLRSLGSRSAAAHLCGHVHDPKLELISQSGGSPHVRLVAAAAHRDPSETEAGKDSHGYNFTSLLVDPKGELRLRVWPRRWFPAWSSFRVDHRGVGDRRFYDDVQLDRHHQGSGLVTDRKPILSALRCPSARLMTPLSTPWAVAAPPTETIFSKPRKAPWRAASAASSTSRAMATSMGASARMHARWHERQARPVA